MEDAKIIKIDKRLFNPIYWHIKDALGDRKIRKILLQGGSSAGKTYTVAQASVIDALQSDSSTLILRKESTTIEDSVYADYKHIAEWVNNNYKFFEIQARKINFPQGKFRFRGMDDPEKVKGIAQYKRIFMNELSKFNQVDFDEIERRLRGQEGQKIIADWNPIEDTHWIKTELIDKEDWETLPLELKGCPGSKLDDLSEKWINSFGDTILIKTTYRDNYWIVGSPDGKHGFVDEHTINTFEKMRVQKPNQYQVYGLGNWGSYRVGGEFWKSFEIDKHVKKVDYLKDKAVHLTVDINRIPYITQTLWQLKDGEIRQFNELCAKEPNNEARKAAGLVIQYLQRINYTDVLYVYGDASGKNKSATDNSSFFDVYIRELRKYFVVVDRILKVNPSVSLSGAFVNDIYAGETQFSISIGDNCLMSKADYNMVKEAPDGGMIKEKVKDPVTGVTYEKGGHLSDAKRYFIVKILEKEYKDYKLRRKKYAII